MSWFKKESIWPKRGHAGWTDITIVLDRSGSMSACRDATIEGFNKFITDQRAEPGSAQVTLYQFDDQFESVYEGRSLSDAPYLDHTSFVPRGMTALYDAVGRSIRLTEARLSRQDHRGKVLICVVTDGGENRSREFSWGAVQALIEDKKKHDWVMAFIGSDMEGCAQARHFGITPQNVMSVPVGAGGMTSGFSALTVNSVRLRRTSTRAETQCVASNFFAGGNDGQTAEDHSDKTSDSAADGAAEGGAAWGGDTERDGSTRVGAGAGDNE